jgi:hypothetical protein
MVALAIQSSATAESSAPAGLPVVGVVATGSPGQEVVTFDNFPTLTDSAPSALIATGSVWRYIDTGANLGTAWRTMDYDDRAWPSGLDKLGFGEGNEKTMLNIWSSNGQQIITYYFRHLFTVPNPSAISNVVLRLLRDDGAVIYLNGIEIRRDNMPAGNISYTTLASLQVGDTEERSYLAGQIPPRLLVSGLNLLAVEVHQASAVSGDLGFSLELIANAPTGLSLAAALDATNLVWTTGGDVPWFGQTQTTRDGVDAAQSGHVPQGSSSWLQTTVEGPGLLTYAFQVRTEHTNSTFRLLVDEAAAHTYSLHLGWSGNGYAVPAGRHTLRWLLENPANGGGSAVAWLDEVRYVRDPISPTNLWPVVRLTSPPDKAMFNGPTNLTLVAEASDPDGRLVRVEFLEGANLLGAITPTDGQTLFSFIASNVPPTGAHSFSARAIDDQGAATVSPAVSVGVVSYPIPPMVSVTASSALVDEDPPRSASFVITGSPVRNTPLTVYFDLSGEAVNGQDFVLVPLQITIPADAASAEVVISVIDDFEVEDVEPVTLTLRSTPPGHIPSFPPGPDGYFIDDSQHEATIRIEDDDVDLPPAVQIVAPVRGSTFVAPVNIQITAEEFDWDFRIESVEFFANDVSLGLAQRSSNETSRSWSLVWSNPPPGEYTLGALSIDEFGRPSRAGTIPVSVVPFIPPQCPWPTDWQLVLSNRTSVFKPTDHFKVVHSLPDGGYILGGESYAADWDYWAVRIDGQGHVLWNRLFGGSAGDQLFDLQPTSDGGFVLGGWSSSGVEGTKTSPNYGGYDFWVVRLDAKGNQLWDRSFGGLGNDGIYGLQQTSDGGYILGGASESAVGGNKTSANRGMYDFWLVRLDANGNKLWDQSYGGAKRDFWAKARQTRDGGFVMFGTSESEPGGNKTSLLYGQDNGWIVRTDANGTKLWDQSYGGNRFEWLADVAELADGGLLFAGGSASDSGGNKTSPAFGEGDGLVLVLNADGSIRSDRSVGGTGFDWFLSLAPTPDGGFVLGAASQSPASGNKTSPNVNVQDPWLVRLDASGHKLWDRVVPGDFLEDVKPTFDGGFIIAGQSWQDSSGFDGWAKKLPPLPEHCDTDGDGVPDDRDQCPNTPTASVVDTNGCSLAQLCPCDGTWGGHGEYVRCVIAHAWQFFRAGLISAEQRGEYVRNAIRSNCGRREHEPAQLHILPLTPEECRRDGFQIILSGELDSTCIIERSSDLERWEAVQTNPVTITGSEIACPLDDARMCFFRIRMVP